MSQGYVYILTNEAMPGLVKIGKTTRSVERRALELHQTGVPFPFEVAGSVATPDCHELERWMHMALADSRVSESREFFLCNPNLAAARLVEMLHEQVVVWMEQFLPNHSIEITELCPDQAAVHMLAESLDAHVFEVVDALSYLTPEELKPAIERRKRHISERKRLIAMGSEARA